jgi:3-(methylthio)propanoyl-CoA dehydrogenase
LGEMSKKNIESALAGATPFLRQFATVVAGWLMAKGALAASQPDQPDSAFSKDKIVVARFYGEHLLPQVDALVPTITGGADLLNQAAL